MGKRSNFERRERDFYPTPAPAVAPLLPFLKPLTWFVEPCAGDGALMGHLESAGHRCQAAFDIEPRRERNVQKGDARHLLWGVTDCFITNPPWSRPLLHELIVHLSDQHPTWLLFDADWPHTRQAVPFLPRLRKIIAVGRVKWIEDSPFVGKDNCCWYLFGEPSEKPIEFVGRA